MELTPYFTKEEKKEFVSKYRVLAKSLNNCLEKDDILKIRQLMQRVIPLDCYGRDKNGINGLIRNINTALICTQEIGLKRTSVISMILYRPVYKKIITLKKVEQEFGKDVTLMIRRLLKTSDIYAKNTSISSDNFHRLLFSFAEDVRVILIMLADRLCMMRIGGLLKEDRDRFKLAMESSFLYAPLAHRMGLYAIKGELEDLSLKYTDRKQFNFIKRKLHETKRSRDAYIAEFIDPVEKKLKDAGFSFSIKGRTKSIYSINNKLKKKNVKFEGIYDLFAIRIILDTPVKNEHAACWQAYSNITDMYQPNPNRLRDWLSIPKSNGYESLHITVIGPKKKWVEVQIRTKRMDEIAEKGLAAHWRYKGGKSENGLDQFLNNVRSALENKDNAPDELMSDIKMDLYQDEIYVFTPNGDLKRLAKGATVLDFAFSIHSGLGCSCVSGKVNDKNVAIKQELHNGDTVSIITSPNQTPKDDWLSFVVTSRARVKIKQALREQKASTVDFAKELLARRFKNRKVDVVDAEMMRYIKKKGYKTVTEFYTEIAEERLDPNSVIDDFIQFETPKNREIEAISAQDFVVTTDAKEETMQADVLVIDKDLTGIDYKLATCCNPIYGDQIFGFVSRTGIKIHRMDCPNAREMFRRFGYKVIPARWSGKGNTGYRVNLHIIGNDDLSIVTTITSVINKEKDISLHSLNLDSADGLFKGDFVVRIGDTLALRQLTKKIKNIKGIKSVQRIN